MEGWGFDQGFIGLTGEGFLKETSWTILQEFASPDLYFIWQILIPANLFFFFTFTILIKKYWDFPGGSVGKNPPANAGDTGSIPSLGRSYILWNN